ncbi:hypothetical protein BV898_02987 [Hypsibius exemplaris]|uniref:Cadherin domain-containing protein n=1 Tax=Hypsibius exemplaris TaxID=2072580 RepID=A0A1W0X5V9_HYPEX|nr:hypothetical protein BV898_02987 [Hypsibius exemplaris]
MLQPIWLMHLVLLFFTVLALPEELFNHPPAVQFNSSNFYLNATCKLNGAIGTITAVGSPPDVVYQIFGSQDFTVHRHRGDVIMVKKPRDPYPLFYISAVDAGGSSATAVVEVSHNCPTVSFDAVSYHFFALRRAPSSTVGHLKAAGGDDIRYSTESEVFQVDEVTGTISAKLILPIDTTSIFYVKGSDRKGNTDVAEVVVEVIGCYMDVDVQHERRYNVVFEKRCYALILTRCESGIIAGAVTAKGYPEPTYELRHPNFYLNPEDGVLMVKKDVEPGMVYQLNVMAKNGHEPDNLDVTLVTVDTRKCPPLSTTPTTPIPEGRTTRLPTTTIATEGSLSEPLDENGNSIPVSPTDASAAAAGFDVFDRNGTALSEDDPSVYSNGTVEENPFPVNNQSETDFFNWDEVVTPPFVEFNNGTDGSTAAPTTMFSQKPSKNGSFVVHWMSVNISKTVKPVYVPKFHSGKIFVKSTRPKSDLSGDGRGMEIV